MDSPDKAIPRPVRKYRTRNLAFLVPRYGGQTALADKIKPSKPTQPMISQILGSAKKRRLFSNEEVRDIESKLGIPNGWMDGYDFKVAWPLVEKFQKLDREGRDITNDIIDFLNKQNHL